MMIKKRQLGQFFTKQGVWLRPHIVDFIRSINSKVIYDPFAGNGDLLKASRSLGFKKIIGLDIDSALGWKFNDSLLNIPRIEDSILITNPPYLTNYSAKRKKIYELVSKYFEHCEYTDLYQLAIEKSLNNDFGIMIVPETFINSSFPKNRLHSITILEENPFEDTENPVCVICFDKRSKSLKEIKIYKNDRLLGTMAHFEKLRMQPTRYPEIRFNDINGKIALRAVDTTNLQKPISFMSKNDLDYDLNGIKHSSRLITLIHAPAHYKKLEAVIDKSNYILNKYREKTNDILLSPFKGNRKDGTRRRRLDYKTARAILERAYGEII